MTWFTIPLKGFHLFKIVELEFFLQIETDYWLKNFKQVWVFYNGMVDKWRGPQEDCIISPILGMWIKPINPTKLTQINTEGWVEILFWPLTWVQVDRFLNPSDPTPLTIYL